MGIQEIIKDGQEDAPTHNVFINDGASDDEDVPVAENIYSDTSSDTESEEDTDFNYTLGSYTSMDSLEEDLQELEDFFAYESLVEIENNQNACPCVEDPRTPPADPLTFADKPSTFADQPSTFADKPSQAPTKKFKNAVPRSRQGVGKKKARRIENARLLDQMRGDDDTDSCDINDFMPSDCTFRFTRVLEDSDLTNKVLNPCVDFDLDYDFVDGSAIKASAKKSNESATSSKRKKLSAQAAFDNLYASEKDLLRRRNLPMGMVEYLDTCVLSFFEENPTGTYVSEPLSSFERLMLHSIAHFYELRSSSFNTDNCSCRLTKVTNGFNYFDPPHLCLSKYVEQLAAQDSNSKSRKCKRFKRR